MPTPDQQESEPLSEGLFERAVRKLLKTPPKPNGSKKPAGQRKAVPKPSKRSKR